MKRVPHYQLSLALNGDFQNWQGDIDTVVSGFRQWLEMIDEQPVNAAASYDVRLFVHTRAAAGTEDVDG